MITLRNLQQIPLIFVPLLLFGYAKELYREEGWKTIRLVAVLAVPSIIDAALLFTDSFHGWMRQSISVETVWNYTEVSVETSTLSSFLGSYSYVISLLTIFLLIRNMFDIPRQYRLTHGLSAMVMVLPLLSITVLPLLGLEIPALFALSYGSMALLLIIINKNRDFNTVWPVSRQMVIENMSEGIMLIDDGGYIVEVNRAICDIAGHSNAEDFDPKDLLRREASVIFEDFPGFGRAMEQRVDTAFSAERKGRHYDVTVTRLKEKSLPLFLVVFKDVTDKKEIEQKLEIMASLDPLTGLMNRIAFLNEYKKIESGAERVFVLMDIDYFKKFNDRYGHVVGDEVLRYMARMMQKHFQEEGEVVTRLGGEEFGILMSGEPDEVKERVDRFRESLKRESRNIDEAIEGEVTVSVGIHRFRSGEAFEKVYHCADQAMYEAKHNGRDQVALTSHEVS